MNLGLYQRMIQRLRAYPRVKVALYETIENPIFDDLLKRYQKQDARQHVKEYEDDIARFERENCLPRFDCGPEIGLVVENFWDPFHMRDQEARQRYTQVLARHVAILLQAPSEDAATVAAALKPIDIGPPATRESPPPTTQRSGKKKRP